MTQWVGCDKDCAVVSCDFCVIPAANACWRHCRLSWHEAALTRHNQKTPMASQSASDYMYVCHSCHATNPLLDTTCMLQPDYRSGSYDVYDMSAIMTDYNSIKVQVYGKTRRSCCQATGTGLGLYSLSGKTSHRQISRSLEAARLDLIIIVSLRNVTGISAALLPRCLSNFRAIGKV